ncbi:MAG: hypothetical protein ABIG44_15095 [Planctomycetota bacterium]
MPENANPQPIHDVAGEPPDVPTSAIKTPPRKKRRRWLRRLVVLFVLILVLLGVLIGLLPTIVSSPGVTAYALSFANNVLPGSIEVERLSLSWAGPLEVRGLKILDPDDQEVVRVKNISCASGVWRLVSDWESFGEIVVDQPRVDLRVTADNEITLVQAFASGQPPASPTESGTLPEPRGRVVVQNGSIHVSRVGGSEFEVTELNGELALKSLADIAGELEMTLAEGGRIVSEAKLSGLVTNGIFNVEGGSGTVELRTEGDIRLGPLMEVAAPGSGIDATTSLKVNATFGSDGLYAEYSTQVANLQARPGSATPGKPIDVSLKGDVTMTADKITLQTNLAGGAGSARADVVYLLTERPAPLALDDILSAILTGESIDLPELSVEAQASVDLVALEEALPGLLHVRPEQQITGGRLEVVGLTLQGGHQPSASGTIELKELTARSGQRVARLEPVSLGFDVHLVAGQGLEISRAELNSSFSHIVASGASSNLRAEFQGNLTKLKQELGQVFELDALELAGELTGKLALTRGTDDRVDVSGEVAAEGLRYATADRRLDLPRASINHVGHLDLADGQVQRLVAGETKVDLNGEVIVTGTGWYDLPESAFHADVDVQQANLGALARRAADLGVEGLDQYAGDLRLQATIDRAASDAPITTGGNLLARGLSVNGQSLVDGDAKLDWTAIQIAPTAVQVQRVQLESSAAALTANQVHWRTGERLLLDGRVEGSADLARCMRALGLVNAMEEPPAIAGRLRIDTTCRTSGDVVTVSGQGQIEQLEVGTGAETVREERLQFAYNAKIDEQRETITLSDTRISSTPFTAEIAGTIDKYKTTQTLALKGRYDASWQELTTLLHELAPATVDMVIVSGQSSSQFEITGPAYKPDVQPTFRGVKAGVGINWDSAELYGVPLGSAVLAPKLRDGRLTLPSTSISAATGKVNLGGEVDFQPSDPVLEIKGKLDLLEDIEVTPELGNSLLSRINPIFMHMTRASGMVHLGVKDIVFPLGEAAKSRSSGLGRLDLVDMKIRPGGLLGELLALGGLADGGDYAVDVSGLDFVLKDGRIVYENFTLTFTEAFDLKFHGSVGLDETLDLVVSLPIRAALLERLGVRGPVSEYARYLADTRIEIPIIGTREKPKLDLKSVDVTALVERAIKASSGKAVDDLFKGLLQGKDQSGQPEQPSKEQTQKQPAPKKPAQQPEKKRPPPSKPKRKP